MPTPREIPDLDVLTKWHNEGLTYGQMADRWYEETRIRKTPAAFGKACRKARLFRNLSHDEWLPRNMRPEHQKLYDPEMIRRWSARKQGKKFDEVENQRINAWLQNLMDADAILWYDPDTVEGWHPVRRRSDDEPGVPVRLAAEGEVAAAS
jgi:hypothetical protein